MLGLLLPLFGDADLDLATGEPDLDLDPDLERDRDLETERGLRDFSDPAGDREFLLELCESFDFGDCDRDRDFFDVTDAASECSDSSESLIAALAFSKRLAFFVSTSLSSSSDE